MSIQRRLRNLVSGQQMLSKCKSLQFQKKKNSLEYEWILSRSVGSAHYYTLTTGPPWFRCKMVILFKYYGGNPNPKQKLTVNPDHLFSGLNPNKYGQYFQYRQNPNHYSQNIGLPVIQCFVNLDRLPATQPQRIIKLIYL